MAAEAASTHQQDMQQVAAAITEKLRHLLPALDDGPERRLSEAMHYAATGGGKRLRPYLVWQSAKIFNAHGDGALNVGAAVEMVHCYSLIHDDLPCMDDDDWRRGRPSVHRQFDEATAVLAGDALLTLAFDILSRPGPYLSPDIRLALVQGLARAAGPAGMVAGQMIDMGAEAHAGPLDEAAVRHLHSLKTGAMIAFSAEAGAILGNANETDRCVLRRYGNHIGLLFQIIDDILDVEGDPTEMGKSAGKDQQQDKQTFVQLFGVDGAKDRAKALADTAIACLEPFGPSADGLRDLVGFIVTRRH